MRILVHLYFRNIVSVQSVEGIICSMKSRQGLVEYSVCLLLLICCLFGLFKNNLLLLLNHLLYLPSLLSINFQLFEKILLLYCLHF